MAAFLRSTVDGGTTEWFKFINEAESEVAIANAIPDLITGDFDSVESHTLNYFRDRGAKVVCTPDQDETDCQKCIRCIAAELSTTGSQVG